MPSSAALNGRCVYCAATKNNSHTKPRMHCVIYAKRPLMCIAVGRIWTNSFLFALNFLNRVFTDCFRIFLFLGLSSYLVAVFLGNLSRNFLCTEIYKNKHDQMKKYIVIFYQNIGTRSELLSASIASVDLVPRVFWLVPRCLQIVHCRARSFHRKKTLNLKF